MRKSRNITSLIVAAAIILSVMASGFAAASTTESSIQVLASAKDFGVLSLNDFTQKDARAVFPPNDGAQMTDGWDAANLSVSPEIWDAPASGGDTTISIVSTMLWMVRADMPSWLTVSQMTGIGNGSFTLTAAQNTGSASRRGVISIDEHLIDMNRAVVSSLATKTITVTQAAGETTLVLTPTSWYAPASGGSKTITVTSNSRWYVGGIESSWLTVSPMYGIGDGSFTLTAAPNTSATDRSSVVSVIAGRLDEYHTVTSASDLVVETITVTQASGETTLVVTPTSWNAPASGGSTTVTVESNSEWTASSSASSWLTVSPYSGNGNGNITLTAAQNTGTVSRSGLITVIAGLFDEEYTVTGASGLVTRTITVTQAAGETTLVVTPTSWNAPASGGSTIATITSNAQWTASSNSSAWITVSPASGSGNGSIILTAEQNTGTVSRMGVVTVVAGSQTRTIVVTQPPQDGTTLTLSPETWDAPASGSVTIVRVASNSTWVVSSDSPSWLEATPTIGTGNIFMFVFAKQFMGPGSRTGIITVTAGTLTRTFTVTQVASPSLVVTPTAWDAPVTGGSTTATVTSNAQWTASSNATSWLAVSPAGGNGNGSLTLTATQNTGSTSRTGVITVAAGTLSSTIAVTQAAGQASDNTDFDRAIDITAGNPVSVSVPERNKVHYYKFVPTVNGVHIIQSSNNTGNPLGYLHNSNHSMLNYDNDNGGNLNFRILNNLKAGTTYYIGATCYAGGTGSYTLTVTAPQ